MTVVKINAITVPADSGDELGRRFAARAGAVDGQPGFEGFELLRPTDDRTTWLVITRWADEASFEAWTAGQDFAKAHARTTPATGGPATHDQGATHDRGATGEPGDADTHEDADHGHADHGDAGARRPVGMSAELWSYEVSTGSSGRPDRAV